MVPPDGDGASPAPIDREILENIRRRLAPTEQVQRATVTDEYGHIELYVPIDQGYVPQSVDETTLAIRWYTNDDFSIHYREVHPDGAWECRWDRHPNAHNTRDHFHPPPDAATPGENTTWPIDYRDVVTLVFDEIETRIAELWEGNNHPK